MSEPEKLNFGDRSGDRPIDAEQVLRELQPQMLEVNRDELFFQAGFAAGSRSNRFRIFWPSMAAALFLVSIGLGTAIFLQASLVRTMRTELAMAGHAPTTATAEDNTAAKIQSKTRASDGFIADQKQLNLLRLALADPLPPGRLTAMGYQESPPTASDRQPETGNGQNIPEQPASEPGSMPIHPATYLELMRLEGKG